MKVQEVPHFLQMWLKLMLKTEFSQFMGSGIIVPLFSLKNILENKYNTKTTRVYLPLMGLRFPILSGLLITFKSLKMAAGSTCIFSNSIIILQI